MSGVLLLHLDLMPLLVLPSFLNPRRYFLILNVTLKQGDLCGTSTQPQATAQAALAQWKKAGFPANQQILGLPLYGYVSQSTKTTLTGSLVSSSPSFSGVESGHGVHRRDPVKEKESKNKKTNAVDTILQDTNLQEWYGQQIPFNELVKSGALIKKSDGTYGQGGGFTMGKMLFSLEGYLFILICEL